MTTFDNPLSIYDSPEPEPESPAPKTTPAKRRGRKPGNAGIQRVIRIVRLKPSQRELLAGLVGQKAYQDNSDNDLARLVTAAEAQGKSLAGVLDAVISIRAADALEAGALAAELASNRANLPVAWAATGAEGPVPSTRPGLALARTVQGISPQRLADIRALLEVLA